MTRNTKRLAAVGAALAFIAATAPAQADFNPRRTTYVTVHKRVALPGVELPPGQYVFELAAPMTDLHIVRVSTRDRSRVMLTTFTELVERPRTKDKDQVTITMGESAQGAPPPILAWYAKGETLGNKFIYFR